MLFSRSTCFVGAAAFLFGAMGFGLAAQSETFPDEPIRLVIPYPPGGALSVIGAVITTSAEAHFGQPMVSLIRSGGGGATGATFAANSDPDGYTLLLGEPTINVIRPSVEDLPYSMEDFVPVARITHEPFIFVAAKEAPFSTLSEMVSFAKENPGDLVYSSDNLNGWTYIAFELLKSATDTQMRGVEFGGGGPATTNVLGGNTMAYAGAPSVLGDHIKSGALQAICISSAERYEGLPDVPTCAEEGVEINWAAWLGIFAPKNTPQDRLETLRESFGALVEDEGFNRLLTRVNAQLSYADAPVFSESLEADKAALGALVSGSTDN